MIFGFHLKAEEYVVEEGNSVSIRCEGFIPRDDENADGVFVWYKAACIDPQNETTRVADYDTSTNNLTTYGELKGRAIIDTMVGALIINKTVVTDGHHYTCFFHGFRNMPSFKKTMVLNITGMWYYNIWIVM